MSSIGFSSSQDAEIKNSHSITVYLEEDSCDNK